MRATRFPGPGVHASPSPPVSVCVSVAFSMRRASPVPPLPSLSRRARPCPGVRSESVASGDPSLSASPLSLDARLVCLAAAPVPAFLLFSAFFFSLLSRKGNELDWISYSRILLVVCGKWHALYVCCCPVVAITVRRSRSVLSVEVAMVVIVVTNAAAGSSVTSAGPPIMDYDRSWIRYFVSALGWSGSCCPTQISI